MRLSYVIVTHNRRDRLLRTLDILCRNTPLPHEQWETWVVDNASTDGTTEAVSRRFQRTKIISRSTNEGVWARSLAFAPARGQYIILLDDDSYPIDDAAARSMAYLDTHDRCAAVVGRVLLPDGSCEACAMPTVMLSGAVCIRKSVLQQVGGFRKEFFRKAGEYDLSFRIWQAGHTIERFEDIVYRHDKVATGRSPAFAHRMDLRNNLILVERYLPADLRKVYRHDWTQRYTAIAKFAGCTRATRRARLEAGLWRIREAFAGRQTLRPETIESLFELESQRQRVATWSGENGIRRVVIADFSKNIYATWRACKAAGLAINALADDNRAFADLAYRGTPIVSCQQAFDTRPDGCIISNVNPAQVDGIFSRLRNHFSGPILRLWHPTQMSIATAATAAAA